MASAWAALPSPFVLPRPIRTACYGRPLWLARHRVRSGVWLYVRGGISPHCTPALSFLSLLRCSLMDPGPPESERAGEGWGGRFIRCALDLLASWFLRILAGARTLKRRLSAAWAHSRGSGDATDGFSAAGVENRRRMQMPATSWGVLYPNAWARNGWSSSASQGMSLCAIGSRVRACVRGDQMAR